MAAVGDEIRNRYVLRERLGMGGMGAVWLAEDTILHRQVALKSPQPGNRRAVARLRTEARNAARLRHPNLVAVYDFFEQAAVSWLVMEYVPGPSLARVLSDTGPMQSTEAAELGGQIAEALAHAHGRGIAHRDVTPENILLTDKKIAKLGDFGISKDLHGVPTLTDGSSANFEKPAYAAPEMSPGQSADCAADVFSLGATIYAAATGHPPHADGAESASATPAATGTAGSLHAVVRRLMATDVQGRPSAAEAANLFSRVNQPDR